MCRRRERRKAIVRGPVHAAGLEGEKGAHPAQVGSDGQRAGHREPLPVEGQPQDRSLSSGRPGAHYGGPLREAALVEVDDPGASALRPPFRCGQRRFCQRVIASSSRSFARCSGRWRLQSIACRIRQTWPGGTSRRSAWRSSAAMRGSVHKMVAYPWARGPRSSSCSTCAELGGGELGLAPGPPGGLQARLALPLPGPVPVVHRRPSSPPGRAPPRRGTCPSQTAAPPSVRRFSKASKSRLLPGSLFPCRGDAMICIELCHSITRDSIGPLGARRKAGA